MRNRLKNIYLSLSKQYFINPVKNRAILSKRKKNILLFKYIEFSQKCLCSL